MSTWWPRDGKALVGGLIILTPVTMTPAAAQEYCVACTNPEAVYRCVLDVTKPQGIPLKTLCVTRMAKDGGHATCAIRGGTVFDCNGPVRRVAGPGAAAAPLPKTGAVPRTSEQGKPIEPPRSSAKGATASGTRPDGSKASQGATASGGKARPDRKQPTVEDLARQAGAKAKKALKDSGDTIGGSTSKAWNCITSLFKSC